MFCKNCGNETKDGERFCSKCGTTVEQNRVPLESGTITLGNNPKKTNLKVMITLLVIIMLLVFLVVKLVSCIANVSQDPAIHINSIAYNPSLISIEYKFENISDKDIAYIEFETYFYDNMGNRLADDVTGEEDYCEHLKYTGPLYSGATDSACWSYLFSLSSATAVVYPKYITVTFTDDEEITFENDFYWKSDNFYGGELKD